MAKKAKWRRHTVEFKRQAVERMKTCDNVRGLARELGVQQKLLYTWKYQFEGRPEDHFRHVFHLLAPDGTPDRWDHFAENKYWFCFEWVPLAAVPVLAGRQGELLHLLEPRS